MPLDGIWARAPYLHNSSVPNACNLLKTTENRPQAFYRGDDTYDPFNLGFHSHVPTMENPPLQRPLSNGRMLILMDTQLRGNGNSGHEVWHRVKQRRKRRTSGISEDTLTPTLWREGDLTRLSYFRFYFPALVPHEYARSDRNKVKESGVKSPHCKATSVCWRPFRESIRRMVSLDRGDRDSRESHLCVARNFHSERSMGKLHYQPAILADLAGVCELATSVIEFVLYSRRSESLSLHDHCLVIRHCAVLQASYFSCCCGRDFHCSDISIWYLDWYKLCCCLSH